MFEVFQIFCNRLDSHSKEHKRARVNKQTRLCAVATTDTRARQWPEVICACFGKKIYVRRRNAEKERLGNKVGSKTGQFEAIRRV